MLQYPEKATGNREASIRLLEDTWMDLMDTNFMGLTTDELGKLTKALRLIEKVIESS